MHLVQGREMDKISAKLDKAQGSIGITGENVSFFVFHFSKNEKVDLLTWLSLHLKKRTIACSRKTWKTLLKPGTCNGNHFVMWV
jgi:hypothetical protein